MASIFFLIFISVALAIVFFSHYFIYASIVNFFQLVGAKLMLKWAIAVLSLSFIVSTLLVHWQDNPFARKFYLISGIWLGFAINLLFLFGFGWLVIFLTKKFGINLDTRWLAGIIISSALVISIYGAWNSMNPRLKNVSVYINNLPANWNNKIVVQISDVHLGPIFTEKFLEEVVKKINSVNPEAVFITGDLFDGMDARLNGLSEPLKQIIAPKGTYFVTGNHETYVGLDKVKVALKDKPVVFLDNSLMDVDGIQIAGISYPDRGISKDLSFALNSLKERDKEKPLILLWHEPTQNDIAEKAGVNLQLSGHTHNGQIFPFNFITRLIYGKYTVGLYTKGDYNEYTSPGTGGWGPTMRTTSAPEITVIKLIKK